MRVLEQRDAAEHQKAPELRQFAAPSEQFLADVKADLDALGLGAALERAAASEKVTVWQVLRRDRHASVVRARHRFISELYADERKSSPEIAALLGLDISTVWHALVKCGVERRKPKRRVG